MNAAIVYTAEGVEVDAALVAEGLELRPEEVPALMRQGEITSRVERGVDADEGRFRLTFFHGASRLTLIVDQTGRVLRRSTLRLPDEAPPAALRRR